MTSSEESFTLHQALVTLRNYRGRAMSFFVVMFGLVLIATAFWPRTYLSEARLFVRVGRESNPTTTTGQAVQLNETREREIQSVIELFRSRSLFEQATDVLGVEQLLDEPVSRGYGGFSDFSWVLSGLLEGSIRGIDEDNESDNDETVRKRRVRRRELAIRSLVNSTKCTSNSRSNVVSISCQGKSPEFAQKKLSCILAAYEEQHLRVNRISGSYEFFEEQIEHKKQELEKATQELRDAKNEVGLMTVDSQTNVIEKEIIALNQTVSETKAELAAAEASILSLSKRFPGTLTAAEVEDGGVTTIEAVDNMYAQFYDLQDYLGKTLQRYTKDHPEALAAQERLREAKENLNRAELQVARSRVIDLRNRLTSTLHQIERSTNKLRDLNQDEDRIVKLEKRVEQLQDEYKNYQDKREQARIDEALQVGRISNINIAQEPSLIAKPVAPLPLFNVTFGLIGSMAGAVAFVFASDWFASQTRAHTRRATIADDSRTIRSATLPITKQTEWPVPVLATMPLVESHERLVTASRSLQKDEA